MKSLIMRIVARILALPFFVWLCILLPAGTNDFWQVYVYFGLIVSLMLGGLVYFLRHDPALLERRLHSRETEPQQKAIVTMLVIGITAGYIIPGFDKRFGWSDIPVGLVLLADGLVLLGYLFMMYVMKVNSFASRVIEVDLEQQLIDSGPYGWVRHPMYAGMLIMYLGQPLALGSWVAYLPFLLVPPLLVLRIRNEEKVLRRDLQGYIDYCQRVKWRLLPGVW